MPKRPVELNRDEAEFIVDALDFGPGPPTAHYLSGTLRKQWGMYPEPRQYGPGHDVTRCPVCGAVKGL